MTSAHWNGHLNSAIYLACFVQPCYCPRIAAITPEQAELKLSTTRLELPLSFVSDSVRKDIKTWRLCLDTFCTSLVERRVLYDASFPLPSWLQTQINDASPRPNRQSRPRLSRKSSKLSLTVKTLPLHRSQERLQTSARHFYLSLMRTSP
jgi:hypothetical protein